MKVVLYFVCLVAAFVLDDVILEAGKLVEARSHYICKGTAGVMGVHELASIFRNTARATGKRYLEDYIKRKIQ